MTPTDDDLKRFDENFSKVISIRHELSQESDRGCALMAASFLDNELMLLLKSKIAGETNFKEDLFNLNGPISTFSSRIKIAYAFGFISKEIRDDLQLIRKIRNEFGHKYEPINFEVHPIKQWISSLQQTFLRKEEANARTIFNNTVLGILAFIHAATMDDQKIVEKKHLVMTEEGKATLRTNVDRITKTIIDLSKSEDTTDNRAL